MEAFIVILMVVVVGVIVAAVRSGSSGSDSAWTAAALRLGLEFDHADMLSSPTITGTRRGLSVGVDTISKSGDDNRVYTRYRVSFKQPLGLGLRLIRQGPMAYISRKLGTRDIETGDRGFDETVVVKGRDPDGVLDFLTPTRRLRIARFLTLYPGSSIDDNKIENEERNLARSPDHIVQMIQRMTTLAELLVQEKAEAAGYLAAFTAHEETTTDEHLIVHPSPPAHEGLTLEELPLDESEPVDEAYSTEEHFDAPPSVETADFNAQGSDEPQQTEVSEQVPQQRGVEALMSSDVEGLDSGVVLHSLFEQGHTTAQTTELFESRYKGRSVAWSGTLINVRTFRFDLVFGDVPGTRAEIELANAVEAPGAGRTAKAVVQFPVDAEDELRALVDKRITFSGVLFSCDAFMKTLFLANGRVSEVEP